MPSFLSSEHAPLVRWFWCAAFDEALIDHIMRGLRECGYSGLLLWPPEAPPGYLGKEWMRRVHVVAEACRTHELSLWLPDDWKAPSGSGEMARGQSATSDSDTQLGSWSLRFAIENLSREAAAHWQAEKQKPLAAWAVPLEGKTARWHEACDLLLEWNDNPARGVASFNEAVQVVSFFAEKSPADIDRLASQSARQFLQGTHEAYRAALDSELFGTIIRGFWTRGPGLGQSAPDQLPWSPQLPPAFAERHGYDLLPRLGSLITPWGEDAVMVRQHFWQTVIALLDENWWQPLRNWCEENQLQLMLWARLESEESFNDITRSYGDLTPALRAAHCVLVTAQESSLLTRWAASIAALENQELPRALWLDAVAPQERISRLHQLWQQGVGGHIAPGEEPFEPFTPALADWNGQLADVAKWLAESRQAGRIGVLLPMRSIWAHYHPKGHRFTRLVWEDYLSATRLLEELHFDFLLVGEDDITSALLQEGQLLCGCTQIAIEVLVLPGATTLSWELWRRLKQFVETGGKVICLGLLPRWSERGRDSELEQAVSQTTMLTIADLYEQKSFDLWGSEESSTGFPITRQNERGGRWACYQPALNPDRADARLRVRQMLKDSVPAPLEIQSSQVRFARRETPNGNLFFLANAGAAQQWHLRLRATRELAGETQQETPILLERFPGQDESKPLQVWSQFSENEGGGFGLDLVPAYREARWIECRFHERESVHLERASFEVTSYDGQTARGYALHSGAPRLLVQQGGRFQSRRGTVVTLPAPLLLADEWVARRVGPNIWHLSEWFRVGSLEATACSSWHSSFEVNSAAIGDNSLPFWAYVNNSEAQLFLNGEALPVTHPPSEREAMWSALPGVWFSLAPLLAGHNAIDCSLPANHAAPQVLLVGEFDFDEEEAIGPAQSLELRSGSWHEQGLPYFAGALDYTQVFKAPVAWENCRVFLELAGVREGVALHLNDRFCGTHLSPPWRFDVTDALQIGVANTLRLRVWNSRAPLFSTGELPPAGLLGPARLVAYPFIEMKI